MSHNGTYHECDYCGAYCCSARDDFEDNLVKENARLRKVIKENQLNIKPEPKKQSSADLHPDLDFGGAE